MAPKSVVQSATFEAPTGTLKVWADQEQLPSDAWFSRMLTSLDIEAIHLPIDDNLKNLTILATRATESVMLLEDDHIVRYSNVNFVPVMEAPLPIRCTVFSFI